MTDLEKTIIDMFNIHTKKGVEASRQENFNLENFHMTHSQIYKSLIDECIIGNTVLNHLINHNLVFEGIYIDSRNEISLHLSLGNGKMTQSLKQLKKMAKMEFNLGAIV